MGFLAPLTGSLIKGAVGLGSSLLGNKLSKSKPSKTEQQVMGNDLANQKYETQQGQNLLTQGTNATQPVLNYWSSILSGNRGSMTSAMAPEISRIGQGYEQAGQTSAALNPRGGPSASFNAELPYRQQHDVSTLLQQARPQAAGQMGSLGMNLLSQGTNLLQASTAAGRNVMEQQRQQKQTEAERGKAIGGGLFDILNKYGFPAIDQILKNRGGTPTSTDTNSGLEYPY